MFNPDYEKRLLRQLHANFATSGPEARPFSDALPLSGGIPGSSNDTSPIMGPPAKRRRISPMLQMPRRMAGGDRFIPVRAGNNWQNRFAMITESGCREDGEGSCEESLYSCMLKNELLGASIQHCNIQCDERRKLVPPRRRGLFRYMLPDRSGKGFGVGPSSLPHYSLSPVSAHSEKLLRSERETPWKILPMPFMVVRAPELLDDFHLNLVDWSSKNIVSLGSGSRVYLWYFHGRTFPGLCDFSRDGHFVTSVAWNERGNLLAVGTDHGCVQVWDVAANKQLNKMEGRLGRVCSLAWNGDVLSSGSSDTLILQHDVRMSSLAAERRLVGHEGEVCSLKWSPDKEYLASGGSDRRLLVWNMHSLSPVQTYTQHLDVVKAIAWSPRHHGLLASGGGMADRYIRFWNTLTGLPTECAYTGSQICNLAWSKDASELVSTHGFPGKEIHLWKYPSLKQVTVRTSQSHRLLYLTVSPSGKIIMTGSADQKLQLWDLFNKVKARSQKENKSVLRLFSSIR